MQILLSGSPIWVLRLLRLFFYILDQGPVQLYHPRLLCPAPFISCCVMQVGGGFPSSGYLGWMLSVVQSELLE